ncbi:MAG: 50S ribosomal protein L13 [Lentisphaeraceae bacterium]|nr:50S ribosomal protein L13 [Lentisphaeraceae bacterium]MCM8534547.1 50S ribosomal protein L13 [Lentisphaeraceae bacterium]
MKTYLPNTAEIEKKWILLDAEKEVLGKLAVKIANALRGKDQPTYTPHLDTGANIIVINAEKVQLTGNKNENKEYIKHTGFMGGRKVMTAKEVREKKPEFMIESAVKGMLPKGRLSRQVYSNLHVYAGPEHPHAAQKPELAN